MGLRRRELGALVGFSLLSPGCLDLVSDEEPLRFTARPAPVVESALDEAGYEHYRTVEHEEQRTVEAGGASREVEVVNVRSEYDRRIDLGPLGEARAAVFATFSTPKIEALGRTFNPVDDMDNADIAAEVQSRYESVTIGEEIDRRTRSILGESVDVSKFEGQATFSDRDLEVFVHVGIGETDDEHVPVLAIYPRLLSGEEERITVLFEGVTIATDDQ